MSSSYIPVPSWERGKTKIRIIPRTDLSVLGPLSEFIPSEATDVFLNGEKGMWIDRGAGAVFEPRWAMSEAEVRKIAVWLIGKGNRHLDEATPISDVSLGQGIRVHAVLPPISRLGTTVSIRVPHHLQLGLEELLAAGSLTQRQLYFLRDSYLRRKNLLITGATGSGKTTLLSALLSLTPRSDRIVLIEDVSELNPQHPHVIQLETRRPNIEGVGEVNLTSLVREALRMRPDRLMVGECRGAELRELLTALNTGHEGSAGTMHANSIADVAARLEALGALAGMSMAAIARQVVSAFQLVIHLAKNGNRREISGIGKFGICDGKLVVEAVDLDSLTGLDSLALTRKAVGA